MPGWYIAHVHDAVTPHILRVLEGAFSLDVLVETLYLEHFFSGEILFLIPVGSLNNTIFCGILQWYTLYILQ